MENIKGRFELKEAKRPYYNFVSREHIPVDIVKFEKFINSGEDTYIDDTHVIFFETLSSKDKNQIIELEKEHADKTRIFVLMKPFKRGHYDAVTHLEILGENTYTLCKMFDHLGVNKRQAIENIKDAMYIDDKIAYYFPLLERTTHYEKETNISVSKKEVREIVLKASSILVDRVYLILNEDMMNVYEKNEDEFALKVYVSNITVLLDLNLLYDPQESLLNPKMKKVENVKDEYPKIDLSSDIYSMYAGWEQDDIIKVTRKGTCLYRRCV